MLPDNFPPWEAVYQQTRKWIAAGVFEAMVHDLRALLRLGEDRDKEPRAAILDSRTLRSSPESSGHITYARSWEGWLYFSLSGSTPSPVGLWTLVDGQPPPRTELVLDALKTWRGTQPSPCSGARAPFDNPRWRHSSLGHLSLIE